MKKILLMLIILTTPVYAVNNGVTIVVLRSQDIAQYNIAIESAIKTLKESGTNAHTITYDLKGEIDSQTIIQKIRDIRPSVILSIGTESTKFVCDSITDIPIVFSMVLNPIGNGIINKNKSNITGVTMDISSREQFEMLKSILPDAERIGVIYNPENTGTIIEETKRETDKFGLHLITYQVNTNKEVPDVMERLIGKVDVLWAVPDNTVFSTYAYEHILLFSMRNKIPIMGFSPNFVKAGSLFTLSCDYEDIGRQSSEIILKILNGVKPVDIPILFPRKVHLVLNVRVAEVMGIDIPVHILEKADKVFGTE